MGAISENYRYITVYKYNNVKCYFNTTQLLGVFDLYDFSVCVEYLQLAHYVLFSAKWECWAG